MSTAEVEFRMAFSVGRSCSLSIASEYLFAQLIDILDQSIEHSCIGGLVVAPDSSLPIDQNEPGRVFQLVYGGVDVEGVHAQFADLLLGTGEKTPDAGIGPKVARVFEQRLRVVVPGIHGDTQQANRIQSLAPL